MSATSFPSQSNTFSWEGARNTSSEKKDRVCQTPEKKVRWVDNNSQTDRKPLAQEAHRGYKPLEGQGSYTKAKAILEAAHRPAATQVPSSAQNPSLNCFQRLSKCGQLAFIFGIILTVGALLFMTFAIFSYFPKL